MTRSQWHAEEIVQEVFMRVWIHRSKIHSIKDIKSWLYIITKRIVFDYVVRLSKERNFLSMYKRSENVSYTDDALLPARCRCLLAEAEKKLSPRQKEVYYLKQVKGLHQREIARILNIAVLTAVHYIKSSVSAVRKHVVMNLEMEYGKRA
jgi:RNA polymerase sigma-70 factor (ECF subfamily)